MVAEVVAAVADLEVVVSDEEDLAGRTILFRDMWSLSMVLIFLSKRIS